MEELESIIGVGRSKAIEFYEMGITSVKELKEYKKGLIELNDKVLLGLKYYGVFQDHILRKEVTDIFKSLKKN